MTSDSSPWAAWRSISGFDCHVSGNVGDIAGGDGDGDVDDGNGGDGDVVSMGGVKEHFRF